LDEVGYDDVGGVRKQMAQIRCSFMSEQHGAFYELGTAAAADVWVMHAHLCLPVLAKEPIEHLE
jgi:hypothetical protein